MTTTTAVQPPYMVFREKLSEQGWSLEEFAKKAMISIMDAEKLYNGDLPYSDEIVAMLLEAAFDIPMAFWTGLDKEYQKALEQNPPVLTYEKPEPQPDEEPEQQESHTTTKGETPDMGTKGMRGLTKKPWTPEEDERLEFLVKEAKRYGDPAREAFRKAADEFGRNAGSCSTRYYQLIQQSKAAAAPKKQEPKKQNTSIAEARPVPVEIVAGEAPDFDALHRVIDQARTIYTQNQQLHERVTELEGIESEYKNVLRVLEKARKAVFLGEEDQAGKYRMDRNGNLERIK